MNLPLTPPPKRVKDEPTSAFDYMTQEIRPLMLYDILHQRTCAGALDQAGILASFVKRLNKSSAEAIKRPSTRTVPVLITFLAELVALVAGAGVEVFGASEAATAGGAGVPVRESSGVPVTIMSFPWVSRMA